MLDIRARCDARRPHGVRRSTTSRRAKASRDARHLVDCNALATQDATCAFSLTTPERPVCSRSYSTHPRSARSRCNCSDHDGKLWRWGKSRHSRATRRPRILAHYVFSAHPIALDAPAFDSATSFTLTCACAQVRSRAYARARRARARRDHSLHALSHAVCLVHDGLATHNAQ